MMSATYFGEITELDSRAVWYSDEEDDDGDEDELEINTSKLTLKPVKPPNHEIVRSNIQLNYTKVPTNSNLKFKTCIVSLSSSAKFKNYKKASDMKSLPLVGFFGDFGKVFALPLENDQKPNSETLSSQEEHILWLLFDSNSEYISGYQVGYFVELLREKLQNEFHLNHTNQIIILTQMKLPFSGRPILPPSLIKNQFESALFEQLTLSLNLALIVCLPSPRNFWFDRTKSWPSIPKQIIEHKLNDDSLEKTLIFT